MSSLSTLQVNALGLSEHPERADTHALKIRLKIKSPRTDTPLRDMFDVEIVQIFEKSWLTNSTKIPPHVVAELQRVPEEVKPRDCISSALILLACGGVELLVPFTIGPLSVLQDYTIPGQDFWTADSRALVCSTSNLKSLTCLY